MVSVVSLFHQWENRLSQGVQLVCDKAGRIRLPFPFIFLYESVFSFLELEAKPFLRLDLSLGGECWMTSLKEQKVYSTV